MKTRVVITGMGLVSPLGNSLDEFWRGLSSRQSGIAGLRQFPVDYLPTKFGGEARDFQGHINDFGELQPATKKAIRKGLKVMCREIQMGVAAAQLAISHADLVVGEFDPDRTGVIYGSDYIMTLPEEFAAAVDGCRDAQEEFQFGRWADDGLGKITPLWLLKYLPNMPACHVAIYNDLRGPNNSITLRESSANMAIAEAHNTIVRGAADRIFVGATGSRIHPLRTVHVCLQEEMAQGNGDGTTLSRPFDLQRNGMVPGEGAGVVVLESLSAAQSRGATICGEVVGHGSSAVVDRNGVGNRELSMRNACSQALLMAGKGVDDLGHLHAHGLSTRQSDIDEACAIQSVFAGRSTVLPVTAAKSYFGNLGAGSGMIELISSLMALRHGQLFPSLNYQHPDPACPICVVSGDGTDAGESFISLSVTPQAQASAVLVQSFS